jgi:polyferredoxin
LYCGFGSKLSLRLGYAKRPLTHLQNQFEVRRYDAAFQVCPTGVDVRDGQQLGCITCGLCIDACDQVMDKIGRPCGLIRYASLDELENKPVSNIYQRPRTMIYEAIIVKWHLMGCPLHCEKNRWRDERGKQSPHAPSQLP